MKSKQATTVALPGGQKMKTIFLVTEIAIAFLVLCGFAAKEQEHHSHHCGLLGKPYCYEVPAQAVDGDKLETLGAAPLRTSLHVSDGDAGFVMRGEEVTTGPITAPGDYLVLDGSRRSATRAVWRGVVDQRRYERFCAEVQITRPIWAEFLIKHDATDAAELDSWLSKRTSSAIKENMGRGDSGATFLMIRDAANATLAYGGTSIRITNLGPHVCFTAR